jgi:hypothetical protein
MTLSRDVPQLNREHLHSWLAKRLAKHGESLASLKGWAVHPCGPGILKLVAANHVPTWPWASALGRRWKRRSFGSIPLGK